MTHENTPAPFYDERVEKEKGTIARNAILIATFFSLFSFFFRFTNAQGSYPAHLSLVSKLWSILLGDGVIFFSGAILILIGLILYIREGRDERRGVELARFWRLARKIQLGVSAVSLAVALPLSAYAYTNINYAEADYIVTLTALALLLLTYLLWAYPARQVYFHEKAHATGRPFTTTARTVGRLALILAGLCLLSVAVTVLLHMGTFASSGRFLAILIACPVCYASLFLLSVGILCLHMWLEHLSYHKRRLLSPAVLVVLLLVILLRGAFALVQVRIGGLDIAVSAQLILRNYFVWMIMLADLGWLASLSFFMEEYTRERRDLLVRNGILLTFLATGWGRVLTTGCQFLIYSLMNAMHGSAPWLDFAQAVNGISAVQQSASRLAYLVNVLTITFILVSLMKQKKISSLHLALPAACLVFFGVDIFLSTQGSLSILRSILAEVVSALRTCYLLLLLYVVSRREIHAATSAEIPNNL